MIESYALPGIIALAALLLLITALYCIMFSSNLIRILIGVELVTKALTLLLIAAGFVTGRVALAQALVITLIVVEVVVVAVAAGVVVGSYHWNGSLNAERLRNLKG